MKFLLAFALLLAPRAHAATDLYYKTYGDPSQPAVVFVHGGPGSNSYSFEGSTAEALAARGNFVVTYDQRGSGRSPKAEEGWFTFAHSTDDLAALIETLQLKNPLLIGHSYGGTVSVEFLELHPGIAKGAVLVGNPLSFPAVYFNILERADAVYAARGDAASRDKLSAVKARMFPNGLTGPFDFKIDDIAFTFQESGNCNLMMRAQGTPEAIQLWLKLYNGAEGKWLQDFQTAPGEGYEKNERTSEREFSALYTKFASRLFAIHGDEDGLFSADHLEKVKNLLPLGHFALLKGASHFSFIDQNADFLDAVTDDLARLRAGN